MVGTLLAWAGVVLIVYFRRAWTLLSGAEGPWVWPEVGQALRYSGLPHASEALARAGSALGAAAVCGLAVLGLGMAVARVLAPKTTSVAEWLVLRVALGAGTLGIVLYGLAGVGLYTPPVVRALMLTLAAVACLLAVKSAGRPHWFQLPRPAAGDWPWVTIAVGAVLYAAFCALAPEIEYDALWYHLELPRRWLASGRPVDDLNDYVTLYPLGFDLLFGAALVLDGSVAAKLLHWAALPAAGALAALMARTVSPRASPWIAAAIFVTAPTVFWEGTTAYNDLAVAFFIGLAAYALLRAHETYDRRWLIVAGLQLGFACATKHLALVGLAAILPVLVWSRLRFAGGARPAARARTAAQALAVVSILAVLVPLPWYVRSWNASANPVFPDMYRVFGAEPPERWDALTERGLQQFKDHFGRPRAAAHALTLPWDMTIHGTKYGGTLGPLLLAGLPVMLLAATRHRTAAVLLAGSVLYAGVWASPLSSFQLRFLVPVWVPCAALLAVGTQIVFNGLRSRAARVAVTGALGAILLASLPPWTLFHEGDRRGWDGWLTHVVHQPPTAVVLGGVSGDEWLRTRVHTYGAWQWLNAEARPGARVLTFFGGDQFYAQRARIWSEAVNARGATWGGTNGDRTRVLHELQRLGVSYVLAPTHKWQTEEHRRLDLLRPGLMGAALERVYVDTWTEVYALRTGAAEAAGTTDHSYGR